NLSNIVTVAASDKNDRLASWSSYGGATVDIAAPGVDILSTRPNGAYGTMSGTSMAAPHVTGALALVWAKNPGWPYQQVIDQVLKTADKLPSMAGKTVTGGRLNVAGALGVSRAIAGQPTVVGVVVGGTSVGVYNRVRVTFSAPMDIASLRAGAFT